MTLSVSQLNNYIRGIFDFDSTLDDITVCGEVTNVKAYAKGWYFSLKDEVGAINCFCYASATAPIAGTMAVVNGKVNYLVKSGQISLYVRRLTLTKDNGAAYLRFVELRDRLAKEGLFDEARKKTVPHCCARVGVVTSPTGAVIHDITDVSLRRQPFTEIILYPVKVQGVGADKEICEGIRYFEHTDVDVIIVGRGGGSNEDLSVFNSEDIVRAIAACGKPVVSAVGHGVDFTLCDFVADKRAVTPSEAAEFVTVNVAEKRAALTASLDKIRRCVEAKIVDRQNFVRVTVGRISLVTERGVQKRKIDVVRALQKINECVNARFEKRNTRLQKSIATLNASNPTKLLSKGYAYVVKDGNAVKSIAQTAVGDKLSLTLSDGTIGVTVDEK